MRRFAARCTRTPLSRLAFSRLFATSSGQPLKTALYDAHVACGGKIVDFAGYLLPIKYTEGDINAHLHCRQSASLFDVSHMGQLRITGKERLAFLETLVPSDLQALKPGQGRLSVLTNEKGGIIDDCVITNRPDWVYMVVNAGCKEKDLKHMRAQLALFNKAKGSDVKIEYLEDRSLVALQGPKAAELLSSHLPGSFNLANLEFMHHAEAKVAGLPAYVTRCGYTGEDGFEISVDNKHATQLWEVLTKTKGIAPTGLGARDTLRLEAGLCLYGHDLNEDINPVEGALSWLIGKRRRENGGFIGHAAIKSAIASGVSRKRVGLMVKTGAPAREGAEITNEKGEKIGVVTSGTFSPCLKKGIAMGYVSTASEKAGSKVFVNVRGKAGEAEVVKMPFVPTRYYKKSA